jgi:hypothetical protein
MDNQWTKRIIVVVISAFAIVIAVVLFVVLNRVMKKANEEKRRKIRQSQREEIHKLIEEDIKEAEKIRKEAERVRKDFVERVQQNDIVSVGKVISEPEKSLQVVSVKVVEAKKKKPRVVEVVTPDKKKDVNANVKNVNANNVNNVKAVENLDLSALLNEQQLSEIRSKNPSSSEEFTALVKEQLQKDFEQQETRSRSASINYLDIANIHTQLEMLQSMINASEVVSNPDEEDDPKVELIEEKQDSSDDDFIPEDESRTPSSISGAQTPRNYEVEDTVMLPDSDGEVQKEIEMRSID